MYGITRAAMCALHHGYDVDVQMAGSAAPPFLDAKGRHTTALPPRSPLHPHGQSSGAEAEVRMTTAARMRNDMTAAWPVTVAARAAKAEASFMPSFASIRSRENAIDHWLHGVKASTYEAYCTFGCLCVGAA